MINGWICLHRKILEWEWFDDPNTFRMFIVCLLLANKIDTPYKGQIIKRGQFATSLDTLAREAKMSVRNVRTSLKHLEKTGEISQKSTNRFSVITICKYDSYQNEECLRRQTTDKQLTNKQETEEDKRNASFSSPTPLSYSLKRTEEEKEYIKETTINGGKENGFSLNITTSASGDCESNVKSISTPPTPSFEDDPKERRAKFAETIRPFVPTYGRDMCNDFYAYWTEMSPHGRKMRFEKEKTWSLSRRLATWYRNDFGGNKQLTPTMMSTLPDMFSDLNNNPSDDVTLDPKLEDELREMYHFYCEENGEYYSTFNNYKKKIHPLSERIQKELERKRQQKQQ